MRQAGYGVNAVYRHELATSGRLVITGVWMFLIAALLATLFGAIVSQIIDYLRHYGFAVVAACISLVALLPTALVMRRRRLQIASLRRVFLVAFGYALIPMVFFFLSLLFALIEQRRIPWEALLVFCIAVTPIVPVLLVWYGYQLVCGPVVIIEKGHCRSCGYNLRGTVSGVCSECGSKVAA